MSDFLSKFSGSKYDKLLEEDKLLKEEKVEKTRNSKPYLAKEREAPTRPEPSEVTEELSSEPIAAESAPSELSRASRKDPKQGRRDDFVEETEIDPHYKTKRKRKIALISGAAILTFCLIFFIVYQVTHVKLPDFKGKTITEVREWTSENKIELKIEQDYSKTHDVNTIVSQDISAGKKIAKGSELKVVSSLGADPEEVLALPDFSTMSVKESQKWLEDNKADNLKLVQEYNDTVEQGAYIKLDIANSIPASDYKRGDKATLYYSRGQEILEANIDVPDFTGKAKSDVETWAKTNSIDVTYVEKASSTVPNEQVMGQSVAPGQKVAKKSTMEISISAGKGTAVPDFNNITMSQASSVSGLTVLVRQVYSELPYGKLISQSQEAGTELTEKDDQNIEVVYSAGVPYLRDLRGKNESELQHYFYEEFRSKGAEIYYTSYYVDSSEPRGTVIKQSAYETKLPLNYTVNLGISNGVWYTGSSAPANSTTSSGQTDASSVEEGVE